MDMDIDCARCGTLIDELLDGTLDPATAREVEAHCAGCASCGRALGDTRALLAAAAALPKEAAPAPAVWRAVAARTIARPVTRAPWIGYAAAATVVAALGGLAALRIVEPPSAELAARPAPSAVGAPVRAVANPAMERRALLVSDVGGSDAKRIDPAVLATVERNLAVIHAALAEIEVALQAAPEDPNLRRLFTEIHLQEAALIERKQRISIEPVRRTDI